MDKLKEIVRVNLVEINENLNKVGSKQISRDVVKRGLDKMQQDLNVGIDQESGRILHRLVIRKLEEYLDELRQAASKR
jgi:hypothetical protein